MTTTANTSAGLKVGLRMALAAGSARVNLRIVELCAGVHIWAGTGWRGAVEPVDERGGGRNSDEGMHIGLGAVLGGVIATAVGTFVAKQLGALGD